MKLSTYFRQCVDGHIKTIEKCNDLIFFYRNSSATNIAMRKVAVSLADSVDLRIILSVLYIITEVIRNEKVAGSSDFKDIAETFSNELSKRI